ncbi:winged helix-turn-helix transcriptional regulator [Streptomyces sp. NPDC057746]|uniref:winged helix-turn-helix transcriptional regulator n=1 Tax=Streptomyces sp. NPDC057746 TaxID=3346237 RepID=UPI0036D0DC5F
MNSADAPGPDCSIDRVEHAMGIIRGRWKVLIIHHLAVHQPRRFSGLERAVPQVTQKMLIQQLRALEADGVVRRIVHPEVPPRVEYELTAAGMTTPLSRLSGRVWIHPGDPDPEAVKPCVAVVADDAGSTVVDAGRSPAHARSVQAAMAEAGLPAARRLVYTHHHWDHTWGACAWEAEEIVGHESGAALLSAEARRPWSHAYLKEQVAAEPGLGPSFTARARAMGSWADFAVRPPTRTFADRLVLPGGIEVRHVGGRHAPDSTVVAVPDSGVMTASTHRRSICVSPAPQARRSTWGRSPRWWRRASTGTSTATARRGGLRPPE